MPKFSALNQFNDDYDKICLLNEVFQKSTDESLKKIHDGMDSFITFFTEISSKPGIKWDDIILKFLWQQSVNSVVVKNSSHAQID